MLHSRHLCAGEAALWPWESFFPGALLVGLAECRAAASCRAWLGWELLLIQRGMQWPEGKGHALGICSPGSTPRAPTRMSC